MVFYRYYASYSILVTMDDLPILLAIVFALPFNFFWVIAAST